MNNHLEFFQDQVPQLLVKLNAKSKPIWGEMNVLKMVDHLRLGAVLMLRNTGQLTVPEEKLPKYKAFLMSDKPFTQGIPKPKMYEIEENEIDHDLEKAKIEFLKQLAVFNETTLNNIHFQSFHPSFGHLNATETRQLQFKHIRHHFQQFGIMK